MITGATQVVALLGHPVRHSRSPQLHNRWFHELGIDAVYVALDAPADTDATAVVRAGLLGANLTIPLKQTVLGGVDRLEVDAEVTGAVNTLWWDGDQLVGANTDVEGWAASASAAGPLAGRHAVVLGAGGAAIAVAWALAKRGAASVHFANRSSAEGVCDRLRPHAPSVVFTSGALDDAALAGRDLVVNALPGGARSHLDALRLDQLVDQGTWFDLNYWDSAPPCVGRVAQRGWLTVDGHGMLEQQARRAFARFTGQDAPKSRFGAQLSPTEP